MAGCGGVCDTGTAGIQVCGEKCSFHSTASDKAIEHLSGQGADDLIYKHTNSYT